MKSDKHVILGIHIQDRITQVPDIQKLFSQFGCNIKTRVGLHDVNENLCASTGIILLEMIGDLGSVDELMKKLNQMDGIEVQKMVFSED